MDGLIWVALAGAAVLVFAIACWYAPARTRIIIDTPTSTARAEMHLLWGIGPTLTGRALPKGAAGEPFSLFNDAARVGHALMTPGLAEVTYNAVRQVYDLKPQMTRLDLGLNLADNSQNVVVHTAAQAALATAPAALRERVSISRREAPGAELSSQVEVYVSPAQLGAIYGALKNSRAVREFRKRLTRKIKPEKRPAREVRA
jgi:hypothetical protein